MGAPSNSGGNTGPANRYSTPKKKVVDFVKGGGGVGALVRGVTGAIKKSVAKSKAKKEANVEVGLGKDRISNYRVENNNGGNDGNNTIAQVTSSAPTTTEVSQATATEATPTEVAETTEANRLLKIKKKGRSQSIISGSQGVTKTAANYSLGKKSLLGKV